MADVIAGLIIRSVTIVLRRIEDGEEEETVLRKKEEKKSIKRVRDTYSSGVTFHFWIRGISPGVEMSGRFQGALELQRTFHCHN